MKPTRHIILICVLSFLFCLDAYAIPARGGKTILKQPDGTEFPAILRGDEFLRLLTTADGHAIIQEDNGYYCYAVYDLDGSKKSTGHRVGSDVPASVLASSRNIPYRTLAANAARHRTLMQSGRREPLMKRLARINGMQTKSGETAPEVKHGIVILAQFKEDPKDIYAQFTTPDVRQSFEALLKEKGYKGPDNKATGSAKDYFDAQFEGEYEFLFDVAGPITLKNDKAYYGANKSEDIIDVNAYEMIIEACNAVDGEVDFSIYDDDKDGEVDNVYVFFAGGDEAQGAGDNCIWSHAWYIKDGAGKELVLDGVRINRYACSAELRTAGTGDKTTASGFTFTGIGTFCHEYSHTLGLPDLYDTDEQSGGLAKALWSSTSLMDRGGYNNEGNTPPNFNAIEREILGTADIVDLNADSPYTISPIDKGDRAYRIQGSTQDEYFLIECRNEDNWDKYIYNGLNAGTGTMLVYHVDKSANPAGNSDKYGSLTASERWTYNEVNANPRHQCADLIEAAGPDANSIARIFFPQSNATSFTAEFWDGEHSDFVLTDIAGNSDGTVTFNVKNSSIAKEIHMEAFQDRAIISWKANEEGYTGESHIKIGGKAFDISPDGNGLYCIILGGLENKEYTAQIYFEDENTAKSIKFRTKTYRGEDAYPFIYLKGSSRNDDGSFMSGAKVPLMLFNALGLDEAGTDIRWLTEKPEDSGSLTWYFNDEQIKEREGDGYYTLPGSGTLKAVIDYADGSTDTIIKKITVR